MTDQPVEQKANEMGKFEEQREQFELFVINATEAIHSKETRDNVVARLQKGDPISAVAGATVSVVDRLEQSAEEQGQQLPDEVMMAGAWHIVVQLAEVAEAAKLFTMDQQQMLQAFQAAFEMYIKRGLQSGQIDPEALRAKVQEGQAMQQPQDQGVMTKLAGGA